MTQAAQRTSPSGHDESVRRPDGHCAGPGLRTRDFVQIAANGFGDPENSYAFSMAWYEGHLYVGTVRDMLALVKAAPPKYPAGMTPWPVYVPEDIFELDLRAQIWRYDHANAAWDQVYASPVIAGPDGVKGPRDIGYRQMTVFTDPKSGKPALYIATAASNSRGVGAHILRYTDAGGVVSVSEPGLGDQNVSTFRTLVEFNGRLYSAPLGSGRAWNAAERPAVYETEDPVSCKWREVSLPHFGDDSNDAVYSMAVFNGQLYAGTLNPKSGFQIWKTSAQGKPPYEWKEVVRLGAGRGNLNEAAVTLCVFNDALYVGTGISNGGYDRTYKVGPAASELVRLYPDDSWDIVVGTPRLAGKSHKRPLSGMRPGFDNPCTGYIWSMAVHDGWLYVGTFDSLIFSVWANREGQSPERQKLLRRINSQLIQERAGFELWRSRDGCEWSPVSRNGFGNPYNYGVRNMVSTPIGLCCGTANPFGQKVAVKLAGGWQYVPNPKGGLEVWLGSAQV